MAEQYREPPAIQAAPTLAGDEWPDLHAAATTGKHGPEAGVLLPVGSAKVHDSSLSGLVCNSAADTKAIGVIAMSA